MPYSFQFHCIQVFFKWAPLWFRFFAKIPINQNFRLQKKYDIRRFYLRKIYWYELLRRKIPRALALATQSNRKSLSNKKIRNQSATIALQPNCVCTTDEQRANTPRTTTTITMTTTTTTTKKRRTQNYWKRLILIYGKNNGWHQTPPNSRTIVTSRRSCTYW